MHLGPGDLQQVAEDGTLLIAANASDVCLSCHADSYGAVLGENPLLPPPERGGGNFVFLLEDNLNDASDGASLPIPGDAAGHNVVAPGYGMVKDSRWDLSPGGDFPAAQLGCTSCHDPHGSNAFRHLLGSGPVGGAFEFTADAPLAEGIDPSTEVEDNDLHTAYRRGMSDWCGNCHGRYHDSDLSDFDHPSDKELDDEIRRRYDAYDGDDFPDSGTHDTAYLAAVPFEDLSAATTSQEGPSISSRVMCLTCHRAHASSAPSAGRWDFNVGLLQQDGVVSGSWPIPNPYNSPTQGSLCSKCHTEPGGPAATEIGLRHQIPLIRGSDGRGSDGFD